MTSKKAIIQLSCGDYSDSLYFSDESITSRPDECMASILEEANKLADGPAQVRYKLGEVTRYLSSACLPEFLEMLSLGQCTNGVTMMSLEVVPVDVIDLVSENESEIDEFHDVPSLPATPNTNEQLQGIDEGEKSDGSWEFANEIKEEPQEEEEPKKAEPEPAAGPAPNPTQHIVQHIMAVVTQQLFGLDIRVVLPQLAQKTLDFLASYGIDSAPDSLLKIRDGDISELEKCVFECVVFGSSLGTMVRDELIQMLQITAIQMQQTTPASVVEVHPNFICDGCDMNPILGKRFTSLRTENYDLCEKCMENQNPSDYKQIKGSEADVVSFSHSSSSTTTTTSDIHVAATQMPAPPPEKPGLKVDDVLSCLAQCANGLNQEAIVPVLAEQIVVLANVFDLSEMIPNSLHEVRNGDLSKLRQATKDTMNAINGLDPTTRESFVGNLQFVLQDAVAEFRELLVPKQEQLDSPVVVSCDTANSLVDPGELAGPMVSFIQEEYNLDGAFLVGQFNSSSHSRVRFLNRGSTPIENAALHLCYGDGMGFEGIEFGTIGAGEAFEVLMDLTMTTGERKGMSCWAFTTNDRPIGSLICAEAC
eukprot:GEMP01019659.1.p1 GENE.GEMP01019659.1~~GEMP01019659.1.p1  ORF type:complete len:591 (+),score=147.81 GEMP01019659.1:96-1868(+)